MILILIIIITKENSPKTDISYSNQNKILGNIKLEKKIWLQQPISFSLTHTSLPTLSSTDLFLPAKRQRKYV